MQIRKVKLSGGPFDGGASVASHNTAIVHGEVYVWDEQSDPDLFVHALTAVNTLSEYQRRTERELVNRWMCAPERMPQGVPWWRFNAWVELLRYGLV